MTLKSIFSIAFLTFIVFSTQGQRKLKQDQAAIKEMCGCYEVSFNFAETFEYSDDPEYVGSAIKRTGGLEWVQLVEEKKGFVSMQHLLLVGPEASPYIVKHWRQDWEYENTDFYLYDHDNMWNFVSLPKSDVKGQWTQKVFQVDDSPRYEGSASWVHVDGKSYWEDITPAPLPRREYTQRSDYNMTMRLSRQEIVEEGWIHSQNNDKILVEENKENVLIAKEVGYNVYKKVDDSRCKGGQDYWKKHSQMWANVRAKWNTVFEKDENLHLRNKVDNKPLTKYLSAESTSLNKEEIDQIIESFIIE